MHCYVKWLDEMSEKLFESQWRQPEHIYSYQTFANAHLQLLFVIGLIDVRKSLVLSHVFGTF